MTARELHVSLHSVGLLSDVDVLSRQFADDRASTELEEKIPDAGLRVRKTSHKLRCQNHDVC
jgi:hypothetical protein